MRGLVPLGYIRVKQRGTYIITPIQTKIFVFFSLFRWLVWTRDNGWSSDYPLLYELCEKPMFLFLTFAWFIVNLNILLIPNILKLNNRTSFLFIDKRNFSLTRKDFRNLNATLFASCLPWQYQWNLLFYNARIKWFCLKIQINVHFALHLLRRQHHYLNIIRIYLFIYPSR